MIQGKPSSEGFYCIGWHPEVRRLDEEIRAEVRAEARAQGAEGAEVRAKVRAEGAAHFFSDDGYVFGHPDVVFPAFLRFEKRNKTVV